MNVVKTSNAEHERLSDFTTDARVFVLAGLALIIGAISSLVRMPGMTK